MYYLVQLMDYRILQFIFVLFAAGNILKQLSQIILHLKCVRFILSHFVIYSLVLLLMLHFIHCDNVVLLATLY